jgi:hypothetical protein
MQENTQPEDNNHLNILNFRSKDNYYLINILDSRSEDNYYLNILDSGNWILNIDDSLLNTNIDIQHEMIININYEIIKQNDIIKD